MPTENPTLERLEDQLKWYDSKSIYNQKIYKTLKIFEIILAALIPFIVSTEFIPHNKLITAFFGVLIVIIEGLQGLNQYQNNWTRYRSVAEGLKHEKYLWVANAGPYNDENKDAVFAERIESLISQEHSKWVSTTQQSNQKDE